ncbi:MAG TPA: FecR family protein [Bradyrhizobium sp.]|nr:FecR family protein [Bradyrhizobium sp.]
MTGAARQWLPAGLAPAEAASHWLVRLDSPPLSDREQAAFETWLAASPAHAEAFEAAKRAWSMFDDAIGDPLLDAIHASALEVGPERRRGMWVGLGVGIAASLLAAVAIGPQILSAIDKPPAVAAQSAAAMPNQEPAHIAARHGWADFATARGERRVVRLAEGSTVTLNTDSAIRVAYSDKRRLIHLLRGQALFEVAKNKSWPFVVRAGDREVTALGTVFEVRLDSNRMKVTLVEGKVVVDGVDDQPSPESGAVVPTILTPGQELIATDGQSQILTKVDVEQQLRWRDGFVEFEDVPLEEAVREMNRYTRREMIIGDARSAQLRVSGVFRTGNSERFAAIVGELLPVRTQALPDGRIELASVNGTP